ncbi:hypothetical protein ATANTOWER_004652 [Ataeniobius toweri]|uniref:Uncharacterized protein n=1 Tax=Ataeniobius toweri TaxID=208326 RepID=A0ABU7B4S9_9TELE|nr:hypothetical protein [Ataeniobius toweri]
MKKIDRESGVIHLSYRQARLGASKGERWWEEPRSRQLRWGGKEEMLMWQRWRRTHSRMISLRDEDGRRNCWRNQAG